MNKEIYFLFFLFYKMKLFDEYDISLIFTNDDDFIFCCKNKYLCLKDMDTLELIFSSDIIENAIHFFSPDFNHKPITIIDDIDYCIFSLIGGSNRIFLAELNEKEIKDNSENYINRRRNIPSDTLGEYIGSGSYATIFKSDNDMISKVSFIDVISDEFKNIKSLPQPGSYYDESDISISKLSEKDVSYVLSFPSSGKFRMEIEFNNIINYYEKYGEGILSIENRYSIKVDKKEYKNAIKNIDKNISDFNLYELKLPYVHGTTFKKFLDIYNYNSEINMNVEKYDMTYNYKLGNIPKNKLINIIKSFIDLYIFVKNLNNTYYIFHNDLHYSNLIYNGDKLIIIDFGLLTIGSSNDDDFNDLIFLEYHIKSLILCGCFSKYFRDLFYEHNIIKKQNILSEDNIKNNFIDNLIYCFTNDQYL